MMNSYVSIKALFSWMRSLAVIALFCAVPLQSAYSCEVGQTVYCESDASPYNPITDEHSVHIPEEWQRFVGGEALRNPELLLERVAVKIDGQESELFKPIDGVVFKYVNEKSSKKIFKYLRENKDKPPPYKFYFQVTSIGYVDLAILNDVSLESLCKLDLVGYKTVEGVCLWLDPLNP